MPPLGRRREPGRNADRRSRFRTFALVLASLAACALNPNRVLSQSIRLDRLRAAERPDDGFAVQRLGELGHLRLGVNASGDYTGDPLTAEFAGPMGEVDSRRVVAHMTMAKTDVSLSLWDRWLLFAGFDGTLRTRGRRPPAESDVLAADGPGLGSATLGSRARFLGDAKSRLSLGFQGLVTIPLPGHRRAYRGDARVAARSDLIADLRVPHFHAALNAGVLIRKEREFGGSTLGNDALLGLALGFPLHPRVELLFEVLASLSLAEFGSAASTHLEWLGGVKASYSLAYFSVGAGTGLSQALGTPNLRVVFQLGMLTSGKPVPVEAAPVPPATKPEPKPEPEPDQDRDLVPNRRDDCLSVPEDRDGFRDGDGCPDLDNDADGVPDERDRCVDQPEDGDAFEDDDGCPDPDNDRDGVADAADTCPLEPGAPEDRGCPGLAQLNEQGEIALDQQLQFETQKGVILGESYDLLESVRKILERHPEITQLRIEGHTDSRGADGTNLRLSQARAQAVAAWLRRRGIAASRITSYGCGERHPLADNDSPEGRRRNRRVTFQVVEPPPRDEAMRKAPAACERVADSTL